MQVHATAREGMGSKTARLEDELWSYVSSGDGKCCPLYTGCDFRKSGCSCINDHLELIRRCRKELMRLGDGVFAPGEHDFRGIARPCRVVDLVECLAQSYLQKGGISCPPVPTDLAMLADEANGIEVRLVPLRASHGSVWCLKGKWVVQLNSNDNPGRRRHTLFHEVFHILAHRRATPVFLNASREVGAFNEVLADVFATRVLAPPSWVKQKWVEFKDIQRMAAYFDIPYFAMFLVLRRVGLVVLLFGLLSMLVLAPSGIVFC